MKHLSLQVANKIQKSPDFSGDFCINKVSMAVLEKGINIARGKYVR